MGRALSVPASYAVINPILLFNYRLYGCFIATAYPYLPTTHIIIRAVRNENVRDEKQHRYHLPVYKRFRERRTLRAQNSSSNRVFIIDS